MEPDRDASRSAPLRARDDRRRVLRELLARPARRLGLRRAMLLEVPGRAWPAFAGVLRLTSAAVVAYLLTLLLTDGAIDLTGSLTALLVVQASAFSTLKMGLVRVGAVLTGVLIAVVLSTWIGLTWWSLGAAIAAALLLAKVLRLGDQALETPISAMLILGVANTDVAAETRVVTTLIGAGVGIAFNLLYPPSMPSRLAGQALVRVADSIALPLDDAAEALDTGPPPRLVLQRCLDRARSATREVADAADTLARLRDSRRFNPRAFATTDVVPVLSSGLDTLEQSLLATRSLFAVILAEAPSEERPDDPYGEELRRAFAVVLSDAADCLRAFGRLVVAEAGGQEEESERALAESLEVLRETKAILTELFLTDARDDESSWLLRASVLAAVDHLLGQLDLEERARVRRVWQDEQDRRRTRLPPLVSGMLPHPERPTVRGLDRDWRRRRPRPPTV
ncbi:FUSC family protein [Auraticoccus monumenti]|uniref:Aromatic acid exporter family member 1 n=1 Tax=Auraticoccus monumenti TaxID=675864 RepID=A0A1G7BH91_9ACTN|nr:aromatic acid exporter family protein [Auraticoccus monumenti]SDE25595.1 Aromatic acid exporter family member 1 [Auraticoccus monumenti]